MGKPTAVSASYRDDPDAVSMHTTPEDYSYDDSPEITGVPPSYAASQSSRSAFTTTPTPIAHIPPPLGRCDHTKYVATRNGEPEVLETRNLTDVRYDTDPVYLEKGIRSLAQEAPFPLVYIMGTHRETVRRGDKKETKHMTDFRVVMDLQQYLRQNFDSNDTSQMILRTVENGEKTHRGTITKQRAPGFKQDIEVGSPKPELNEWCHRYCASPNMLRIFRLRRAVSKLEYV